MLKTVGLLHIFVEIMIHYHLKILIKIKKENKWIILFTKDALTWSKVTEKLFTKGFYFK